MAGTINKFFQRAGGRFSSLPSRSLAALPSTIEKVSAAFPGWQLAREKSRRDTVRAKVETAQSKALLASYESLTNSFQRNPRETQPRAEWGNVYLQVQRNEIVEASRNAYRDSKIMRGFINRAADNIVGTGLEVVPKTSDDGYNSEQFAAFREYTRKGGGWEITGRWSLGNAQRTAFISAIRDGDMLAYRSDPGWQLFDGNQMGTPYGYDGSTERIRNGIQFNSFSKPTYYWVADWNTWGFIDYSTAKGLRADKCLHIANFGEFVSESRPLPQYQAQLGLFQDLDKYIEAVVIRAMGDACIMGNIESPHANAMNAISVAPSNVAAQQGQSGTQDRKKLEIAPQQIVQTFPGEKFTLLSTNSPNGNVPDFIRLVLRLLGFPIGLPLELGLMDFTETNFAAAKMALSQATMTHYFWRYVVLDAQLIRPVYLDFVNNISTVKAPRTMKGRADAYELTEPKIPWLEPLKESQALNEGVAGGWDSPIRIAHDEMKREWIDIANENATCIEKGLEICKARGLDPDKYLDRIIGEVKQVKGITSFASGEQPEPPKTAAK